MTGKSKIPNLHAEGPEPEVMYSEFVSRHIDLSIEIADLRERVEELEGRLKPSSLGVAEGAPDDLLRNREAAIGELAGRAERAEAMVHKYAREGARLRWRGSAHTACEGHLLCDLVSMIEADARALMSPEERKP